jgi:hypothetical protein
MCPKIDQRFFADVFRDDELRLDDLRLRDPDDDLRDGTFAPLRRASLSPMAIACLRLFTVRPEPLLSVPRFRRRMVDSTFFDALLLYLAIREPPRARDACKHLTHPDQSLKKLRTLSRRVPTLGVDSGSTLTRL